jgi:hypothetical protein
MKLSGVAAVCHVRLDRFVIRFYGEVGMRIKMTDAMFTQLMCYLKDVQLNDVYWGNRQQFWDRHAKIEAWVFQQSGRDIPPIEKI